MTEQELTELEELANKATPGPWVGAGRLVYRDDGEENSDFNAVCECWNTHDDDFIAAARNAVPGLVKEVRQLRKDLTQALWERDAAQAEVNALRKGW